MGCHVPFQPLADVGLSLGRSPKQSNLAPRATRRLCPMRGGPRSLLLYVSMTGQLDCVRFDPLLPSTQRNALATANPQIDRNGHLMQ